MEYKIIITIVATTISFLSYIPYFQDIYKNKTKPHIFSWIIWALLAGVAFFAQLFEHAGPGAWVTGSTALLCVLVAITSISRGEKNITLFDWVCFFLGIAGILLWKLTNNPLGAVVVVTIVDAIAFLPTFRKAYYKPHEETMSTYVMSALKHTLSITALVVYNPITWLFPASLVVTNILFVTLLVIRRSALFINPKS